MTNHDTAETTPRFRSMDLPIRGLQSLFGPSDQAPGPLSPLVRLPMPEGPGDPEALASVWESLHGEWTWSVPALLDPRRVIALILGDGHTGLVGQYVFPDAEAHGPGFHVESDLENVRLTGPASLGELRAGLFSRLSLDQVADPDPVRTELSADHFWALTACLDAYREVALARRLLRLSGAPAGVDATQIAKAWANGGVRLDPGWTVSLFRLLAPGRIPNDLASRLTGFLEDMVREKVLQETAAPGSGQTLYAVPEPLNPLLWGLCSALHFGLVSQGFTDPDKSEINLIGGWRTPGGVWLADLGELDQGKVILAHTGPEAAADVIDEVFGDNTIAPPWEEFAMETSCDRDTLLARLRHGAEGHAVEIPPAKRFCHQCGQPVSPAASFCGQCGEKI